MEGGGEQHSVLRGRTCGRNRTVDHLITSHREIQSLISVHLGTSGSKSIPFGTETMAPSPPTSPCRWCSQEAATCKRKSPQLCVLLWQHDLGRRWAQGPATVMFHKSCSFRAGFESGKIFEGQTKNYHEHDATGNVIMQAQVYCGGMFKGGYILNGF